MTKRMTPERAEEIVRNGLKTVQKVLNVVDKTEFTPEEMTVYLAVIVVQLERQLGRRLLAVAGKHLNNLFGAIHGELMIAAIHKAIHHDLRAHVEIVADIVESGASSRDALLEQLAFLIQHASAEKPKEPTPTPHGGDGCLN